LESDQDFANIGCTDKVCAWGMDSALGKSLDRIYIRLFHDCLLLVNIKCVKGKFMVVCLYM